MKVGFIGLGKMGVPMASNLIDAGHELTVYNRTASKAELLATKGATVANNPAGVTDAEVVISIPFGDNDVKQVVFSEDGILAAMKPSAIHVCMSTISIPTAEDITAAHTDAGQGYISAPGMGRPEAAKAAEMSIMAAGPSDAMATVQPLFDAMGKRTFVIGEQPSQANLIKLSMNMLLSSAVNAMAEVVALTRKFGIEPHDFIDVITGTALPGPIYETYGRIMADESYEAVGAPPGLVIKDLGQLIEAANSADVPMPIAAHMRNNFLTALGRGYGDMDLAVVGKVMAENAGLE